MFHKLSWEQKLTNLAKGPRQFITRPRGRPPKYLSKNFNSKFANLNQASNFEAINFKHSTLSANQASNVNALKKTFHQPLKTGPTNSARVFDFKKSNTSSTTNQVLQPRKRGKPKKIGINTLKSDVNNLAQLSTVKNLENSTNLTTINSRGWEHPKKSQMDVLKTVPNDQKQTFKTKVLTTNAPLTNNVGINKSKPSVTPEFFLAKLKISFLAKKGKLLALRTAKFIKQECDQWLLVQRWLD